MSTTMSDAAQIRIAEVPPAMCSGCFNQQPDKIHIDFGASWDGPVLQGAHPVSIDELILCERCVRIAAKLLHLTDSPPAQTLSRYKKVIESHEQTIQRLGEYIQTLHDTLAAKKIAMGEADGELSG